MVVEVIDRRATEVSPRPWEDVAIAQTGVAAVFGAEEDAWPLFFR
jgi:hypothetical protein